MSQVPVDEPIPDMAKPRLSIRPIGVADQNLVESRSQMHIQLIDQVVLVLEIRE